jgi:hypothetical protein
MFPEHRLEIELRMEGEKPVIGGFTFRTDAEIGEAFDRCKKAAKQVLAEQRRRELLGRS